MLNFVRGLFSRSSKTTEALPVLPPKVIEPREPTADEIRWISRCISRETDERSWISTRDPDNKWIEVPMELRLACEEQGWVTCPIKDQPHNWYITPAGLAKMVEVGAIEHRYCHVNLEKNSPGIGTEPLSDKDLDAIERVLTRMRYDSISKRPRRGFRDDRVVTLMACCQRSKAQAFLQKYIDEINKEFAEVEYADWPGFSPEVVISKVTSSK